MDDPQLNQSKKKEDGPHTQYIECTGLFRTINSVYEIFQLTHCTKKKKKTEYEKKHITPQFFNQFLYTITLEKGNGGGRRG